MYDGALVPGLIGKLVKTHEQFADDLALYALDELTGSDRQELEAHLETCAACRRELQALRGDLGLLGLATSGPQPPARAKERLMRAIAGEPRGVSVPNAAPAPRQGFSWAWIPTLAAAILLFALAGLWRSNGRMRISWPSWAIATRTRPCSWIA